MLYLFFMSISDKRVEDWFLMQGYTPTLVITAVYVLFVTWIGPKFMENREPFKLKWPIVIYNFMCIAVNFHIFKEVGWGIFCFRYFVLSISSSRVACIVIPVTSLSSLLLLSICQAFGVDITLKCLFVSAKHVSLILE